MAGGDDVRLLSHAADEREFGEGLAAEGERAPVVPSGDVGVAEGLTFVHVVRVDGDVRAAAAQDGVRGTGLRGDGLGRRVRLVLEPAIGRKRTGRIDRVRARLQGVGPSDHGQDGELGEVRGNLGLHGPVDAVRPGCLGVAATGEGVLSAVPGSHGAHPRKLAAHHRADAVVVAHGEHPAAGVHVAGEHGQLAVRDRLAGGARRVGRRVAARTADQPDDVEGKDLGEAREGEAVEAGRRRPIGAAIGLGHVVTPRHKGVHQGDEGEVVRDVVGRLEQEVAVDDDQDLL